MQDFSVDSVKIGMLGDKDIVKAVHKALLRHRPRFVVLDTPIVSKSGYPLLDADAIETLKELLLPSATLITPNSEEAKLLAGMESITSLEEAQEAAHRLTELGAKNVLIKGGHIGGDSSTDLLLSGGKVYQLKAKRYPFEVRGTGCVLASAIASNLAKGKGLLTSVRLAKEFITNAIEKSIAIGKGYRVMPLHGL
jgi:hydroxymethylpyrimidine/phosphomethylpyrimidine kinase